ncbi:hypothetical protein EGW08_003558 [Elysia chlorotica]|uniref:Transporter n=1 Tax=Elysia chlorotica TaxID=188477 RepID=A0A3S1ACW2_ELYCH|nr:hypothetical protein EGW08_003558 [Elysia chlorotica]
MTAEQEEEERGGWGSHLDYTLSAVGLAVGLGNVWRFPYLAYRNGGASFLVPYVCILATAGLPLFFVETSLGQFTSMGALTCWEMAPLFSGLGYAMVITGAVVAVYYNMLIAYAFYFMMASFVSMDDSVPWKYCNNDWNTPSCRREGFPDLKDDFRVNASMKLPVLWDVFYHKSCVSNLLNAKTYADFSNGSSAMYDTFLAQYLKDFPNSTGAINTLNWYEVKDYRAFDACKRQYTTPSEEYFERQVLGLHKSSGFDDLGGISVKLVCSLALSWLLIFACVLKGIKTSGKVVYFTALFPYFVLTALLIKGLTLDGSEDGIDFYIVPEWDKLKNADVWGDAANQIFYSLGIGFGGQLTMSSYNKFRNNCLNDAVLVSLINCGTSVFAGFAIFSLLGHMAHVTGKDVEDVATSGPGLAFVAYPDGISRLDSSPVWGFLFFFMLITLGMDSQFATIETLISGFCDKFPHVLRRQKTYFTFVCCFILFLAGLPQCTDGGIRVLTLLDDYSGSYNLLIIALLETVCIVYVYGLNNYMSDIEMMLGFKPQLYWKVCWSFLTPAVIVFVIVITAVRQEGSEYNDQSFPDWADAIGWASCWFPILVLIIVTVLQLRKFGWPGCIQPTSSWGPSLPSDRTGRYAPLPDHLENGGVGDVPAYHNSNSGTAITTDSRRVIRPPRTKTADVQNGYGACQNGPIYDVPSH